MHTAFRVCFMGVIICTLPLVLTFVGAFVYSFMANLKNFIKKPNVDDFLCLWIMLGLAFGAAAGVFAWLDKEA